MGRKNGFNFKVAIEQLRLFAMKSCDRRKNPAPKVLDDFLPYNDRKNIAKVVGEFEDTSYLTPFKSSKHFAHFLKKKGFETLGNGYYSSVYSHPKSDRVIKVMHKTEEDGWLSYVKWAAKEGYIGTHAPKVYSYKWVKTKGNDEQKGFGVAVMERLEKTVGMCRRREDTRFLREAFDYAMEGNSLATQLLEQRCPGMTRFGILLKEKFAGHLDMHGGNYMVRKDGTLVVTDPVSSMKQEKTTERLRSKDFSENLYSSF